MFLSYGPDRGSMGSMGSIRPIRLIRGKIEIHRTGRFILVYRLAMDAKTRKGDDGAD